MNFARYQLLFLLAIAAFATACANDTHANLRGLKDGSAHSSSDGSSSASLDGSPMVGQPVIKKPGSGSHPAPRPRPRPAAPVVYSRGSSSPSSALSTGTSTTWAAITLAAVLALIG